MVPAISNYSPLDKLVHRLAFCAPGVQIAAADIERLMFQASYAAASADRPILITSLPRAGTTLLLTLLHGVPGIATHLYRDMPFVAAPVLWQHLSGRFRKQSVLRERAHGDGMLIGFDSPEAFEEILWRALWPEKYDDDQIQLWHADDLDADATDFLRGHFKKIVSLRCPDQPESGRYVSKNNANIARLELISTCMPDAKILIPVRRPLDHAASLHRQHMNFLNLHHRDAFARRYMADIGHYEFGLLRRPIAFPRLQQLTADHSAETLNYWLGYWIAAFEYILENRSLVSIVSYEDLCLGSAEMVGHIFDCLDLDPAGRLEAIAGSVRSPTMYAQRNFEANPNLISKADELYAALVSCAIGR